MVVDDADAHHPDAVVGMIVTSRAGRDAGDRYVVVGVAEGDTVLVADGRKRAVDRPKRKNVKHLIVHGPAHGVADRLRGRQRVTDEDLRETLVPPPEGE
jgi:ribosomal protein L14E/L6E/L27E